MLLVRKLEGKYTFLKLFFENLSIGTELKVI